MKSTLTGAVHVEYSIDAVNRCTSGEIRPLQVFHVLQGVNLRGLIERSFTVFFDYFLGVESNRCCDLVEVVWRNLGGHPNSDAVATVQ